ncbi:MAG: MarR family transcriptional regulator [Microthrixaceae bacterium]|nr:MarR family transcriptional regulator [Microthrixaceae bacterium]
MGKRRQQQFEESGAEDDLLVVIQRLGRLIGSRQVAGRITDAAGVEISQQGVQILRSLLRHGELPIAGVAAAAHMDISAVSRQLGPLEEAGLTARGAAKDDGRVVLIRLTPSGRRVAQRIRSVGLRHLQASLIAWSADEKHQLAELLGRLIDDMQRTDSERVDD